MGTLWFWLLALMIAAYVLLDGFDLGAGAIHLVVARTDEERKQVLSTIGPVWNGNEVWLIATGGVLYFAFPGLYASGFSGFYLPLMIVLWLLILRGVAIEFRDHIHSEVWDPVWDFLFCTSSLLLCVFFGAALGNVIRGVPLDASGYFFEPLWTNFLLGEHIGILDWYTFLVGLLAFAALIVHGALWVALKTTGPVYHRSLRIARLTWWAVVALTIAVTITSFRVQPAIAQNFRSAPWGYVFPLRGHRRIGRHTLGHGPPQRMEQLPSCGVLSGWNALQRRLWSFPYGASRAQCRIFADRRKHTGR